MAVRLGMKNYLLPDFEKKFNTDEDLPVTNPPPPPPPGQQPPTFSQISDRDLNPFGATQSRNQPGKPPNNLPPLPPEWEYVPEITETTNEYGETKITIKWQKMHIIPPYPDKENERIEVIGNQSVRYSWGYVFDKNAWKWVPNTKSQKEARDDALEGLQFNIPRPPDKDFTFDFFGEKIKRAVAPTFNKNTMAWEYTPENINKQEDNARLAYNMILANQARKEGNELKAKDLELENQKFLNTKTVQGKELALNERQQWLNEGRLGLETAQFLAGEKQRQFENQQFLKQKETEGNLAWLRGKLGREPTWSEFYDAQRFNAGKPDVNPPWVKQEAPWWYNLPGGPTFAQRNIDAVNTMAKNKADFPKWNQPNIVESLPEAPESYAQWGRPGFWSMEQAKASGLFDPGKLAFGVAERIPGSGQLPGGGWMGGSKEAEEKIRAEAEKTAKVQEAERNAVLNWDRLVRRSRTSPYSGYR